MSLALSDIGVAIYMVIVMVVLLIGSIIAYRKDHRADTRYNKGDSNK